MYPRQSPNTALAWSHSCDVSISRTWVHTTSTFHSDHGWAVLSSSRTKHQWSCWANIHLLPPMISMCTGLWCSLPVLMIPWLTVVFPHHRTSSSYLFCPCSSSLVVPTHSWDTFFFLVCVTAHPVMRIGHPCDQSDSSPPECKYSHLWDAYPPYWWVSPPFLRYFQPANVPWLGLVVIGITADRCSLHTLVVAVPDAAVGKTHGFASDGSPDAASNESCCTFGRWV